MMKNINPTQTAAWSTLEDLFNEHSDMQISELFAEDSDRFNTFSRHFNDDFLLDFSKNLITEEILVLINWLELVYLQRLLIDNVLLIVFTKRF